MEQVIIRPTPSGQSMARSTSSGHAATRPTSSGHGARPSSAARPSSSQITGRPTSAVQVRARSAVAAPHAVDTPASDVSGRMERLVPLWRHAVWLVALFALLTMWVDIRVDVQQVRKDLDRSGRAHREAKIQNDRLQLELDARRRSVVLESAARQLEVGDQARLVWVADGAARPTPSVQGN